jgi:hypothetical protein
MGALPHDVDSTQHAPGRAWPDREIGALGGRQRTHVTHAQLQDLGVGRGAIWRAARRRRLHRVHHGVYSLVEVGARPPLAAEHAAILACGPRAVISHDSAAVLWGLREPVNDPVTVTMVSAYSGRRRPGLVVHRVSELDRRDIRRRHGLPVTSPARMLLDVTPTLSTRELEQLVDECLVRRLTSRTAIREMLDRYPGRAGSSRLRALIDPDRPTNFTRSQGEELMLALIRRGGLPAPECNVKVQGWEVDFLWRRERLIVEADSWRFHGLQRSYERDHQRDADLERAGFHVLRLTWYQLEFEAEACLVAIATALATRMATP